MKRAIILCALLIGAPSTGAQMRLTIEECYRLARANYPLIEQLDLVEKTAAYHLENAGKGWLPQIVFSAQASYQSEVTQLPFDLAQLGFTGMEIPLPARDQYGARVEVSQTIWDGGAVKSQREGIRTAAEVERADTEANLYAVNGRVNGLFFGILLAEGQLDRIALLEDDLARSYRHIETYVRNGVATQTDLDAIRIEQLKAAQQKAALSAVKKAYVEMLSHLTGTELGTDTEFVKPPAVRPSGRTVNRPELALFEAQIRNLDAQEHRLDASITPRIGLFATGGYGRPGLNMLSDRFEPYYVIGAKLSWNIGGWYTRRNDRRQIQTGIRSVEVQRNVFRLNTGLDIAQRNTDIDRCFEQLRYDDEIIALRGSVRRSSEARLANGTLSGSDLARDIDAAQAARQDKIVHEMELLTAIYNLKYATNR